MNDATFGAGSTQSPLPLAFAAHLSTLRAAKNRKLTHRPRAHGGKKNADYRNANPPIRLRHESQYQRQNAAGNTDKVNSTVGAMGNRASRLLHRCRVSKDDATGKAAGVYSNNEGKHFALRYHWTRASGARSRCMRVAYGESRQSAARLVYNQHER